jgi:lysophospholipase L1-like esterase
MRQGMLALLLFVYVSGFTQQATPAFWNDIQKFKQKDSASFPRAGQILLVGSSSFTKWTDVQEYFPSYPIINRGFGGSTLKDLIRYADVIITPYNAKQIVIYCGENDLAESDSVSAETVIRRFQTLFQMVRSKNPAARITFITLKPSPSRQHLFPKMQVVNKTIENFLKTQQNTSFINVYDKMLKTDGTPMEEIFVEDRLHMNAKGYAIWQKEMESYLLK